MPILFQQGIETWSLELRPGGEGGKLGSFDHANTVDRTYRFPDKDGTVALLSDLDPEGLQVLSEAMPALTCFRINSDNKAFVVTANDSACPLIDGITLEAGGIGSRVKVARTRNRLYETPLYQVEYVLYWLTASGTVSSIRPVNTRYQVMVGRSISDSNTFIFDPQPPILLIPS